MQKFCSSYQAQTLEAYWVICHHCQAHQCLHPFLTTHKSFFQSNQTESLVSLAANSALWASKLLLCVVHLCRFTGAWIICFIDTSTGQRAGWERAWGWDIEPFVFEIIVVCPGLAGDSRHPRAVAFVQWFGGHDSARSSPVSVLLETHQRDTWKMLCCCWPWAGQHRTRPLGDNGAASLSYALLTGFGHGIINSGPIIIVLLMENAEKSTIRAKLFLISYIVLISN